MDRIEASRRRLKKFIALVWMALGIAIFAITASRILGKGGDASFEIIGSLIGFCIIFLLPTYLILRKK
jgi:hypothetical protein